MQSTDSKRNGLVLIEVVVIVCSLLLLFSVMAPAVLAAREAARRSQCKNNLHQIGLAIHNYHDTFKVFPPGWIPDDPAETSTRPSRWAWGAMILPWLDQRPLYGQLQVKDGKAVPPIAGSKLDQSLPVFHCVSD